jgi:AcrR family transcriptional regulator
MRLAGFVKHTEKYAGNHKAKTEGVEGNRQVKSRTEEVYTKAAMLFRQYGYLNTPLNEIAKSLGIQKGSLYYYITDKETLLFNILNKTMDNMLELVGNLPLKDLPPDKKLSQVIRAHIVNAVQYLNEFSVLLHDTQYLPPKQKEIILSKEKKYEDIFLNIIREGIEKKIFADYDPKMVAYMILGSCNWLYQWFSPKAENSSEEIAKIFSKLFLNGLARA